MRVLIVDTFYGPYLQRLYMGTSAAGRPWQDQHRMHFDGGFGTSDAYSQGLGLQGINAIEIVANSVVLQQAWAKEHRSDLLSIENPGSQLLAILEAQMQWFKATVLYIQDINWLPSEFIRHVKNNVEMVVGQNACPLKNNLDLTPYDMLLTSLPHYVGRFRKKGVNAVYFPIGFDERRLKHKTTNGSRQHELTFVGGLGGYHGKGTQMLEAIARALPLQVWGYGGEQLPSNSILKQRWNGEAWAEEMYRLLANSQITINRHIDIAEGYANNMRLYEATGMGACLMTDAKQNLACLFEPNVEIVTYTSPSDAIGKLKELMEQPEVAREIAAKGQIRTIKEYNYNKRMEELVHILKKGLAKIKKGTHKGGEIETILMVCPGRYIEGLPYQYKNALRKAHTNHKIYLISDVEKEVQELNRIKLWKIPEQKGVESCICCIDALEPDHVIHFIKKGNTESLYSWEIEMKKYTDTKKILWTTIGI